MAELTNISSEYDLTNILTDIGKEYLGMDLSTERLGLFGFISESMAHIYGAALLDSSIRSREYLVTTAARRDTLMHHAFRLGIDIPNAAPSSMILYFGIKADSVVNFGKHISSNPNVYKLVIERGITFHIGEYLFSPEFDIEITATYSAASQKYSYSARYLTAGDVDETCIPEYTYPKETVFKDIGKNYIPCYRTGGDSEDKVLIMKIDVMQLTKSTRDYVTTDIDEVPLTGEDFTYNDQFVYANVFYKSSTNNEWQTINLVPKYDTSVHTEKCVYYELIPEDKVLRIDFTHFVPEFNSTFRVDIYSTKGAEVNSLVYTGDGSDIKISLSSVDERHTYSGLDCAVHPIETDASGRDELGIEELRSYIIQHTPLLNSVITESDIEDWLNLNDNYNEYKTSKYRSDIINMTFDVNSLIKFTDGSILPTRTIDNVVSDNIYVSTTIDTNNRYHPAYDILVNNTSYKAFIPNIMRSVQMTCMDTDDTAPVNFRIDHINIQRGYTKNYYKINVTAMTDGDYPLAYSGNGHVNNGNTKKVIMFKGFLYDDNGNITNVFNFDFLSYNDGFFDFEARIDLDQAIIDSTTNEPKIKMLNLVNMTNVGHSEDDLDLDEEFFINGETATTDDSFYMATHVHKLRLGIGCYYLNYEDTETFLYVNDSRLVVREAGSNYVAKLIGMPDSINLYPQYTGICEYAAGSNNYPYILCDVYTNDTDLIDIYPEVTDIFSPKITNDDGDVVISIPCIADEVVSGNIGRIHDIFFETSDRFVELKNKLLNNFDLSYRFFNTSGPAVNYQLCFSNGTNGFTLTNLDLDLDISVGLIDGVSDLSTQRMMELKTLIRNLIEGSSISNSRLYISDILAEVKNKLNYIKYIELNSINGSDARYRVIKYEETDSSIAEFVSVPLDNIMVTIE